MHITNASVPTKPENNSRIVSPGVGEANTLTTRMLMIITAGEWPICKSHLEKDARVSLLWGFMSAFPPDLINPDAFGKEVCDLNNRGKPRLEERGIVPTTLNVASSFPQLGAKTIWHQPRLGRSNGLKW